MAKTKHHLMVASSKGKPRTPGAYGIELLYTAQEGNRLLSYGATAAKSHLKSFCIAWTLDCQRKRLDAKPLEALTFFHPLERVVGNLSPFPPASFYYYYRAIAHGLPPCLRIESIFLTDMLRLTMASVAAVKYPYFHVSACTLSG